MACGCRELLRSALGSIVPGCGDAAVALAEAVLTTLVLPHILLDPAVPTGTPPVLEVRAKVNNAPGFLSFHHLL